MWSWDWFILRFGYFNDFFNCKIRHRKIPQFQSDFSCVPRKTLNWTTISSEKSRFFICLLLNTVIDCVNSSRYFCVFFCLFMFFGSSWFFCCFSRIQCIFCGVPRAKTCIRCSFASVWCTNPSSPGRTADFSWQESMSLLLLLLHFAHTIFWGQQLFELCILTLVDFLLFVFFSFRFCSCSGHSFPRCSPCLRFSLGCFQL